MKRKSVNQINKIIMLNISIMMVAFSLMACEKQVDNLTLDKGPDDFSFSHDFPHLTDTTMISTGDGEVLFSFTLTAGGKDAVVYYSVDGMDFKSSVFLSEGVNINLDPINQGPSCRGVKLTLPTVYVVEQTLRQYNFKITRPGGEEKIVYFGFNVLPDGRYSIYDSNRPGVEQDFYYYIKADKNGNPAYINMKFN